MREEPGRFSGMQDAPEMIATRGFPGYELLDSGAGRKLERFGAIVVDRPEAQAIWSPALPAGSWRSAAAQFISGKEDEDGEAGDKGRWKIAREVPECWPVEVHCAGQHQITMLCRLMTFRHLGLFPEQIAHWNWIAERIMALGGGPAGRRPRVLNLFAYTGAATLIAAQAGAEVVHVDASKRAIGWARENQTASGLQDAPIRWICEDARKFVAREVRRDRRYDVIVIDPPKFGRGPGGEVWDLFSDLPALLGAVESLLSPQRSALVLTAYAIRASSLSFGQLLGESLLRRGGKVDFGELVILPNSGGNGIATSHFARWWSE